MRFLRFELAFVAMCCASACARPTLDELEPDAAVDSDEEDSGATKAPDTGVIKPDDDAGEVIDPPPERDAGTTTKPDTGTQVSDDDAGLPPPLANCKGAAPPTNVTVGDGHVTSVTMKPKNGSSMNTTLLDVGPGTDVTITVVVKIDSCSGAIGVPVLYFGLDGASTQCRPGFCSSGVSAFELPFSFTVKAPQEPGLHDVLASLETATLDTTASCIASSTTKLDARIAALCVSGTP